MYLTYRDRDDAVKIVEIAEQFEVPRNHLIKVANKLGKLGWVDATRGRNGGLRLAIAPSKLKIGEILKQVEGCTELIDCSKPACSLRGGCKLKGALDHGLSIFYDVMNNYTLEDIVGSPTGEKIAQMNKIHLSHTG